MFLLLLLLPVVAAVFVVIIILFSFAIKSLSSDLRPCNKVF